MNSKECQYIDWLDSHQRRIIEDPAKLYNIGNIILEQRFLMTEGARLHEI